MNNFHSIAWQDGRVSLLDQGKLPQETIYLEYTTADEVAESIHDMVIRAASLRPSGRSGQSVSAVERVSTSRDMGLLMMK